MGHWRKMLVKYYIGNLLCQGVLPQPLRKEDVRIPQAIQVLIRFGIEGQDGTNTPGGKEKSEIYRREKEIGQDTQRAKNVCWRRRNVDGYMINGNRYYDTNDVDQRYVQK